MIEVIKTAHVLAEQCQTINRYKSAVELFTAQSGTEYVTLANGEYWQVDRIKKGMFELLYLLLTDKLGSVYSIRVTKLN